MCDQFKDEYKRQNAQLLEENEKLRSENSRLFSSVIEEQKLVIEDLQKTNNDLIDKLKAADDKYRHVRCRDALRLKMSNLTRIALICNS